MGSRQLASGLTPEPAKGRRRWPVVVMIALIAVFYVLVVMWFVFAGRFLVEVQEPATADAVVVLSGDPLGDRLRAGVDTLLATESGRLVVFQPGSGGLFDADTQVMEFLERRGVSPDRVRLVPAGGSTAEEAGAFAALAHECDWTVVDVVTSPFHTRRAGYLFRRALGAAVSVAAVATDDEYDAARWWREPNDREVTLLEWVKILSDAEYAFSAPTGEAPDVPC